MSRLLHSLAIAGFALALLTQNAYAYIDPGSGSVVTTAIIGFFAAIAYTLRKYFYKISDLFSSKSRRDEKKD